jgi:hypothetical protein
MSSIDQWNSFIGRSPWASAPAAGGLAQYRVVDGRWASAPWAWFAWTNGAHQSTDYRVLGGVILDERGRAPDQWKYYATKEQAEWAMNPATYNLDGTANFAYRVVDGWMRDVDGKAPVVEVYATLAEANRAREWQAAPYQSACFKVVAGGLIVDSRGRGPGVTASTEP